MKSKNNSHNDEMFLSGLWRNWNVASEGTIWPFNLFLKKNQHDFLLPLCTIVVKVERHQRMGPLLHECRTERCWKPEEVFFLYIQNYSLLNTIVNFELLHLASLPTYKKLKLLLVNLTSYFLMKNCQATNIFRAVFISRFNFTCSPKTAQASIPLLSLASMR